MDRSVHETVATLTKQADTSRWMGGGIGCGGTCSGICRDFYDRNFYRDCDDSHSELF